MFGTTARDLLYFKQHELRLGLLWPVALIFQDGRLAVFLNNRQLFYLVIFRVHKNYHNGINSQHENQSNK